MIPINSQPIEKRIASDGQMLSVHSIFYTIQGESIFCGYPAVFIRLAGCNLKCDGCDTDYTTNRKLMSIFDIEIYINQEYYPCRVKPIIVITGGEPFRQNIGPLIQKLHNQSFTVQIETNGTLPLPHSFFNTFKQPTIICSPKTAKINSSLTNYIDAYKYVLSHDSIDKEDGLPILALNHINSSKVARPPKGYEGKIYLQPMDSKDEIINKLNLEAVKKSCMKYGYIFGLQIHKIIGLE